MAYDSGFSVQGLGFRVWGCLFRVQDLLGSVFGVRVSGFGFRCSGSGFGVWGSFLGVQVSVFGFHVSGFGIRGSGFRFRVWGFKFWGWGFGNGPGDIAGRKQVCKHTLSETDLETSLEQKPRQLHALAMLHKLTPRTPLPLPLAFFLSQHLQFSSRRHFLIRRPIHTAPPNPLSPHPPAKSTCLQPLPTPLPLHQYAGGYSTQLRATSRDSRTHAQSRQESHTRPPV